MTHSGIVFEHIRKQYGRNTVVHDLNMIINRGERLVLLGPSGCGKTTTLRMIAGLEDITSGVLKLNNEVVNDLAPGERNIAMVFQNYALYPHMTVRENITFGLRLQKPSRLSADEINLRTEQALAMLNLTEFGDRYPKELSGGQKQRVALSRAIVKQASFFLLDEPLSNLDAQLRLQARTELVKLHEIYQSTLVYVTHDQVEAMTVGQRIAILERGDLQQLDTPDMIYRYPANRFVAGFIGSPPMNLLQTTLEGGALYLGGERLELPSFWRDHLGPCSPQLGIRPEHCQLSEHPILRGKIELVERLGSHRCLHVRLSDGQRTLVLHPAEQALPCGAIGISFDWEQANFFDQASGINLGQPALISGAIAG